MAVFLITFSTFKITIMKLISLAKKLDFTTESEYFDYCIDTYYNGQFEQCKRLFKNMSKADRKSLITYISESGVLPGDAKTIHNFYFNLL